MTLSEIRRIPTVLLLMSVLITHAASAEDAEDAATKLAKQTQNPVSSLISVPFELNYNGEFGPNNSDQVVLNIKPVMPVRISENWNLINRVIMPLISQPGLPGGPNRKNGLGDTVYQAFLSPAEPGKVIWGAGPQIQIPTHTDEVLGNEHWGAGPAAVVLTMPGKWVLGGLVAQMWDVASSGNDGSEADISQTTIQPFVNYNFGGGWYVSTAPVITANWEADNDDEWTVPVGGGVGRVFKMGKQQVNMKMAYYYNVAKPDFGAQWDMQLTFFLLFPK
ncbi:MAG: neuromedin U [Sedimenticolaceae bacterium]